jgi:hypothetical protein
MIFEDFELGAGSPFAMLDLVGGVWIEGAEVDRGGIGGGDAGRGGGMVREMGRRVSGHWEGDVVEGGGKENVVGVRWKRVELPNLNGGWKHGWLDF